MPWATAAIALIALVGGLIMLYPGTAAWFAQVNQSQTVVDLGDRLSEQQPAALHEEIEVAHAYNDALITGTLGENAVIDATSNVPTSTVHNPDGFEYASMLPASADGVMARLRIPSISVDLPIYHGTSETTLLKGAGHLEGTSLPVGGESQHAVITAHRGLPQATLFNDLDRVQIGDTFTIEVFGEVLAYRVISTQTILPDQSQALLPEFGRDLVTLVTCTPLGLNTHRYLVTGERITPTPASDIAAAGEPPSIPRFPWWILGLAAMIGGYVTVVVLAGRSAPPHAGAATPHAGAARTGAMPGK